MSVFQNFRQFLVAAAFLLTASAANASIIYSFDVSDVSWTSSVQGDWSSMVLWFEFTDTANLNALTGSEVLRMGFDNGVTQQTFDRFLGGSNIGVLFGIADGIASLTVGDTGADKGGVLYCSSSQCPGKMQLGQANFISMYLQSGSGDIWSASAGRETVSQTYFSREVRAVSSPGNVALLGLGAALLYVSRRNSRPQ